MAEKKLFYNPTLQTGSQVRDSLKAKKERGEDLTEREKQRLEAQEYKIKRKQRNLLKMVKMGVRVVAGSDGIGLGNSARLIRAMELMVEAGLTPMQVIVSATSNPAKALKMDHLFGTIKPGLKADIIAVKGEPSKNISDLRSLKMVMQEGKIITLN
jgi:imidazolonepropionase-like amidohydrolase